MFNEITTKNPSNLTEDINLHIQEAEQTSNRINSKESMPRHIEIKSVKTEDRKKILIAREKHTFSVGKEQFEYSRFLTRNYED